MELEDCKLYLFMMKLTKWLFTSGIVILGLCACKSQQKSMGLKTSNLEKLKLQLLEQSLVQDSIQKTEASLFLGKLEPNFQGYTMDMNAILGLEQQSATFSTLTIKIYGGNWCSDTHEGVPGLLKVLDKIGFDAKHLEYHYVSRDKSEVDCAPANFQINSVPWIRIYRDNELLGEIIEFPRTTWEGDLLKILKN